MGCNRRTAAYAHAVAVRFDMSKLALPSSPHKAHGTTMDGESSSDGAHYEASPPQPHRLWAPLRLCVWASWHCCPPLLPLTKNCLWYIPPCDIAAKWSARPRAPPILSWSSRFPASRLHFFPHTEHLSNWSFLLQVGRSPRCPAHL